MAHEAVGIFHSDNDPLSEAEAWSAIVDLNLQSNKKQAALDAAVKWRKVLQVTDNVIKAAAAHQTEAELHLQNGDYVAAMRIAWQGQLACKGAKHLQGEVQALILVMQAAVAKMKNDGKALDKINLDKVLR